MRAIWNFISAFTVIALAVWFIQWYIKGHFGKHFIFFWLWTIISISLHYYEKSNKPKEDTTPGYVYWERNVRGH
jgi:hypothetical protein